MAVRVLQEVKMYKTLFPASLLGLFHGLQPSRELFDPNPTQPRSRRNNGAPRFDPHINRHTNQPHEHKREIARRMRQTAARATLPSSPRT
ncbi:hypothetical protein [Novosphingobium sp. FSW06-99]|uniref:hypothetical protein n=1 Tax=Novosphingobium sp. FSW06-99 TaxID=1739113 RepID=UPI00076DDD1C|nr:hypothetical protein [Novosphingobium sp. FSW06-99]KUR80944.1 hypothetical protein AQZ49_02660 [Novosphingobium sp. FSW06-99]